MRHDVPSLLSLALAALLVSCGGDSPSSPDGGDDGEDGSFTLVLGTSTITLRPGGSDQVQVTVARGGGFTGTVDVRAVGVPAGLAADLQPAAVSGATSTLSVTADADLAPGAYSLEVQGSAAGLTTQTAALAVTVEEEGLGGEGVEISLGPCGSQGTLEWLAYRDGDGPWTAVEPDGGNVFEFVLREERAELAWVEGAGGTGVAIYRASAEELAIFDDLPCPGSASRSVTVPVAGLADGEDAQVSLGGTDLVALADGDLVVPVLREGPIPLVVSRRSYEPGSVVPLATLEEMILRRNLDPPHQGRVAPVDFDSDEPFAPVEHDLTLGNLAGWRTNVVLAYIFAGGIHAGYFASTDVSADEQRTYPGIPTERQETGEVHHLFATASSEDGVDQRTVHLYFEEAGDLATSMGPPLGATDVTVEATSPYARPRLRYTRQPEYDGSWLATLYQLGTSPQRLVAVWTTAAWQQDDEIDLELPDFSGLDGWDDAWGLVPGATVRWSFNASGWNVDGGVFFSPMVDGAVVRLAARTGEIVP